MPFSPDNLAMHAIALGPARTLLFVYHSMTGGTRQMVEAAVRGAQAEGSVQVVLKTAAEAGPADVLAADGLVFATPENLAAISGALKDFFDRSYYPVLDQVNGRPCAFMVCAGSDGQSAVRQLQRIATGWRLRVVAEPLVVCTHAQTPEAIAAPKVLDDDALMACEALGESLATGLALGVF